MRVLGGAALSLKSPQVARLNPVARRFNRTASLSGEGEPQTKMDKDKEKEKRPPAEHHQTKTIADTMTDSFGEGYSTRSDEEGFGGVYGGNDPVLNPAHLVNHPEYDKSQGSEVKEKEKSRNLPPGAHTA